MRRGNFGNYSGKSQTLRFVVLVSRSVPDNFYISCPSLRNRIPVRDKTAKPAATRLDPKCRSTIAMPDSGTDARNRPRDLSGLRTSQLARLREETPINPVACFSLSRITRMKGQFRRSLSGAAINSELIQKNSDSSKLLTAVGIFTINRKPALITRRRYPFRLVNETKIAARCDETSSGTLASRFNSPSHREMPRHRIIVDHVDNVTVIIKINQSHRSHRCNESRT